MRWAERQAKFELRRAGHALMAAAVAAWDSPALLCARPTHTLTHMRIYKSLLNLQGTFMQLLFDMVASFLIHSIRAALHKIDNDYVNMPHQEGSLSMCVCA